MNELSFWTKPKAEGAKRLKAALFSKTTQKHINTFLRSINTHNCPLTITEILMLKRKKL